MLFGCGSQNYLILWPVSRNFKILTGTVKIFGLEENIKTSVTSGNNFAPKLTFICKVIIGVR